MAKINHLALLALLTIMFLSSFGQEIDRINLKYYPENKSEQVKPCKFPCDHVSLCSLTSTPQYKAAQYELDNYSVKWQKEIEDKYSEIEILKKSFLTDSLTLSDNMKTKRRNEINSKEKKVIKLEKKYFGQNGDLDKKRHELIKRLPG